ncbi:hypothetical protein GCM10010492_60010 [Saccharothrix mutabilis subsp. mutabilis]|uniref:Uncharacterized protein n=1 Tax=Saccharothrix mutabilis subsp. mutabilis TaxID=66855 RepID=A0ABN0UIB8_9PSEU
MHSKTVGEHRLELPHRGDRVVDLGGRHTGHTWRATNCDLPTPPNPDTTTRAASPTTCPGATRSW